MTIQTERNKNTLLQKELEDSRTKLLALENEMKKKGDAKIALGELEKEKMHYKKLADDLTARVERQGIEFREELRKKEAEFAQMQYDKRVKFLVFIVPNEFYMNQLLESKIDDMTNIIRELTTLQDEDKRALEELLIKLEESESQVKKLVLEKEELLMNLQVAEGTLEEAKASYEERISSLHKL